MHPRRKNRNQNGHLRFLYAWTFFCDSNSVCHGVGGLNLAQIIIIIRIYWPLIDRGHDVIWECAIHSRLQLAHSTPWFPVGETTYFKLCSGHFLLRWESTPRDRPCTTLVLVHWTFRVPWNEDSERRSQKNESQIPGSPSKTTWEGCENRGISNVPSASRYVHHHLHFECMVAHWSMRARCYSRWAKERNRARRRDS